MGQAANDAYITRLVATASASACDVDVEDVLADNRTAMVCTARWAAMAALRSRGWTLTRIGGAMGRDHSSVSYSLQRGSRLHRTADEWYPEALRAAMQAADKAQRPQAAGRPGWALPAPRTELPPERRNFERAMAAPVPTRTVAR